MSNYIIRPLTIDDALEASEIWTQVFGDDERLVFEFYRLFSHQYGFGMCAELDGKLVATAYCPEDMYYVEPDGTEHAGAYLYAVATLPAHRKHGLAKKMCHALLDIAWEQGKEFVFTKPSEESLYGWYEEKVGMIPAMGGRTLHFTAKKEGYMPFMQLLPDAYLELRTKYLEGLPHVRQSIWWLKWEQNLHDFYGGGFYAVGDYIVDMYHDGSTLQINEMLPHPTPEAAEEVCYALMTIAGAEKCSCTIYGDEKYVSVAANQCDIPKNNPWFGPCFG